MGGEVAFAIRQKGRVKTCECAKGAVHLVSGLDLFRGKLDELDEWHAVHRQPFAPIDYGIVVVDFDTKWVGSIQDFCSLDKEYFYDGTGKKFRSHAEDLFKAGRLRGFFTSPQEVHPVAEDGFDAWFKKLKSHKTRDRSLSVGLCIDPPRGWTFSHHSQTKQGWSQLLGDLLDRNWEFSENDIQAWQRYLVDRGYGDEPVAAMLAARAHEALDASTPTIHQAGPSRRF